MEPASSLVSPTSSSPASLEPSALEPTSSLAGRPASRVSSVARAARVLAAGHPVAASGPRPCGCLAAFAALA